MESSFNSAVMSIARPWTVKCIRPEVGQVEYEGRFRTRGEAQAEACSMELECTEPGWAYEPFAVVFEPIFGAPEKLQQLARDDEGALALLVTWLDADNHVAAPIIGRFMPSGPINPPDGEFLWQLVEALVEARDPRGNAGGAFGTAGAVLDAVSARSFREDPNWTLGAFAYRLGVPATANPHPRGSDEATEWGKGWLETRKVVESVQRTMQPNIPPTPPRRPHLGQPIHLRTDHIVIRFGGVLQVISAQQGVQAFQGKPWHDAEVLWTGPEFGGEAAAEVALQLKAHRPPAE